MSKTETPADRVRRKCREHWPPISHSRLARRLDLDASAFSRILSGERRAPDGMYQRIAEILGCPLEDIMSSDAEVAA